MNERARNLKLILESIIANEEESKEFEKLKTIPEIYEKCIAKGYKGGMEEFTSDLMTLELLPKEMIEMIEEKLNEVSGGKLDAKKGIASILSGLTVMSAGGININAAQVAPKEASKKTSVSSKKSSILNKFFLNKVDKKAAGIGASIGAGMFAGGYILRGLVGGKNIPAPVPVIQDSKFINLMREIENFISESEDADLTTALVDLENIISSIGYNDVLNAFFRKSIPNDSKPVSLTVDIFGKNSKVSATSNIIREITSDEYLFRISGTSENIAKLEKNLIYAYSALTKINNFSVNLNKYINKLSFQSFSATDFSKKRNRNFMLEIYQIKSNIKNVIDLIDSSTSNKKEEAIKNLKRLNDLLSQFEKYLYNKVMSMQENKPEE